MRNLVIILLVLIHPHSSFAAIGPIINGDTTVCVGLSISMLDTTAGGTWSISDTTIATVDSSGNVTGVAAGSAMITYTAGPGFVTTTITVNPLPAPILASVLCAGGSAIFTDSTPGGFWNIITAAPYGGTGSDIGPSFSVFGLGAGPFSLQYTLSTGCTVEGYFFVYPPPPPITGAITTYVDSTTAMSDAQPGGIWSSSNPSVAAVGSLSGTVTGMSAGVATIYYSAPCTTSIAVTILQSVAIPLLSAANSITISPNPATTVLTITSTENITGITITNLIGQVVYNNQPTVSSQLQTINVASLPPGMYMVKVNGTEISRFVKQ